MPHEGDPFGDALESHESSPLPEIDEGIVVSDAL
jgi:hypothetical protein